MDEQLNNSDIIAESLKTLIQSLEQAGADPGEITSGLMGLVAERCRPEGVTDEAAEMLFDDWEIILLSIGNRLAEKRSARRGITTDPALALLGYASEQALALLGREKLRSFLESQCVELTCASDFWGKS